MIRRSFSQSRKIATSRRIGTGHTTPAQVARQSNKVEAEVYIDGVYDSKSGKEVVGTVAECSKCGHKTKSFGVKEGSQKRCLVLLKSECPRGESNFYVEKEKEFECPNCGKSAVASAWMGDDYTVCPHCEFDKVPF